MKIYFDGSCRPNPGSMRTAVVAGGRFYHKEDVGYGDNNDAEWLALIHAVEVACSLEAQEVTLLGDSALVVNQATGKAACRDSRFASRLVEFQALVVGFHRLRIRRIGRSQNLAGIALERLFGRL